MILRIVLFACSALMICGVIIGLAIYHVSSEKGSEEDDSALTMSKPAVNQLSDEGSPTPKQKIRSPTIPS